MARHTNPNAIEGQPCLRGDVLLKNAAQLNKLYPIVVNMFFVFSAIGILLFGFDCSQYVYTFIGQSFWMNAVILILSHHLRFCAWHRILIYSQSLCLFLETLNNFGIKFNYYIYDILIINISAIILLTINVSPYGQKIKKIIQKILKKNYKTDKHRLLR